MPRWIEICGVDDIARLGARVVRRAAGCDVAIFRAADDRVFALLDRCPHRGGPLSEGIVFGYNVSCPLHAWTIGIDTGEAAAPDRGCVKRFEVRIDAGRVYLDADELEQPDQIPVDSPAPTNAVNPTGLSAGMRIAQAAGR